MKNTTGFKALTALSVQLVILISAVAQVPVHYPYTPSTPASKPLLFGEGVISTRDDEFGGTFTPDGKTIYFSKSVPGSYLYVICSSSFQNGKWTEPVIVPFSGKYRDFDPVISPDGLSMLFASDRPVDTALKNDYDIWITKWVGNSWSAPVQLPAPINSTYDEHFASMASNGNIYFSSTRPGAAGGEYDSDVYRCKLVDGKYTGAERLDSASSTGFELDVIVAPDERYLLIGSVGRPEGLGHFDIFISKNKNGSWTGAKNAGPLVNSRFRDYSPRITPDGKYLLFTSEKDFTATDATPGLNDYDELTKAFRGIFNGTGNIYEIELDSILTAN